MAEVERDLEVIFDVMPTSEDLPSKLLAEKVYALCYRVIINAYQLCYMSSIRILYVLLL